MSTDTLSDVLRAVRLTGAVFFDVNACTPWVAESPPARDVADQIMPGSEHVISYHLVAAGGCYASLIEGSCASSPVRLDAGDFIIFPQGDPHVLSSEPGMRGKPELEAFRRPRGAQLPIPVEMPIINFRGRMDEDRESERATLVCGFLGCDARPFNPVLATLPRLLHIPKAKLAERPLANLTTLAMNESKQRRSGSECVLARLSELLFVEAVRIYVDGLPPEQSGWLAGLRDPHVGRALAILHDRPAEPWTLDDLAREVGLSRSLLAERFQHFVGLAPIQYLTQWRMQLAAERLRGTTDTLAQIAERVGYGSESAFSRAFKRLVGVAPAIFRERGLDGVPPSGSGGTSP